jgi:tRNA1(Val) A37 N6-methylase TrmN6
VKNVINEIEKHKEEMISKNLESKSFNEKVSIFETKILDWGTKSLKFFDELKAI